MSDTSLTMPRDRPATRTWARRLGVVGVLAGAGLFGLALPASAASASTWDSVAQCESSGNWSFNTGNGYYGGLHECDTLIWPRRASLKWPHPRSTSP